MAQSQTETITETTTESRSPSHVAWHVNGSEKKKFWSRVGAAWAHKDGKGFNLQLETFPIDGRIVLRIPQESKDDSEVRA